MRTVGRVILSMAIVAGLAVAASRAAEEQPAAQSEPNAPSPVVQPPASTVTVTPKDAAPPPSVTIIGASDAHGVLGRDVRSAADEDMGRIVDVIVDRDGHVRAAVIDFGGFLGVGSRKIVVDWNALRFGKIATKKGSITLELTKAQVAAAPEFKEDTPMVVLGASGSLQPLQAIP
ncbi:photosystem reaction center subunit H [Bradyrhizobium centrolobii]|uniref:Photosystem reaction center subunit H n=1 Tax=Bradyrhizobium centrolobii TaxID=1505087 RepID=A0A176YF92_9BRAD|nr:PRC-barrel domain-containing protein [Bradyrhizobium centrolobii]OAF03620.1 photosystem reaction center subunit H [Bradyrhizobium centrolobii]